MTGYRTSDRLTKVSRLMAIRKEMTMGTIRHGIGVALGIGALTLAYGAFAQGAKPPAGGQQPGVNKVTLKPMQKNWTKVCGKDPGAKKKICYTTRDFGQDPKRPPVMAVAIYDPEGAKTKIIRLLLPVALLLQAGFRFSVDKSATQDGNFEICFPNGCFAQSKIDARTLRRIKRGKQMNVFVKNQVGKEVVFVVPLGGFAKAYDGKPIDPKVLQAQQQALKKELEKRAIEQRKRLESGKK